MKKLIALTAIFALLSFFSVQSSAQDSDAATINLTYNLLGGCVIELSAYSLDWATIPVPVVGDEWISADDVPIDVNIGYKLDSGHQAKLKASCGVFSRIGDAKIMLPEMFFQAIYTGEFSGTFPFPATGGAGQLIWSSSNAGGRTTSSLDVQFFSQIQFGSPGDWTGSYTLTVYDEIV